MSRAERKTQRECEAEVFGGNKMGMEKQRGFFYTLICVQNAFLQSIHSTYAREGQDQTNHRKRQSKFSWQENR